MKTQSRTAPLGRAAMNRCGAAFVACGLIASIAVATQTSASPTEAARPWFTEVAKSVGLDFFHYNGMTGGLYFPEMTGGSVAVLDYDNDGDLDVYFGQGTLYFDDKKEDSVIPSRYPHPVKDRLFRNELISQGVESPGVLKFVDVTEQAGLQPFGNNMGVVTGDINNDGFPDLYLTNADDNVLLLNNGDGTFRDHTKESGTGDDRWTTAASFFDYDRDGWLDLMVGNYVEFRRATVKTCTGGTGAEDYCGPQSYPPLDNKLFRNKGDGTFEDVTVKALVDASPGTTLGLVAGDFNGDGWIDMYVANDLMANDLWLNQQDGTFLNDAMFMGAAVDELGHAQASMGVVAGDFNADGFEDLFMAHLASEMNTVYFNDGNGTFRDGSRDSGLGVPSWEFTGFGAGLGDFNNDGLMDLYLGNGAVKRVESQLRAKDKHPLHEKNLLFSGTGPGMFAEVVEKDRVDTAYSEVSRGVAVGDLDNDGVLDLVVANNAGPARLLRGSRTEGDWLGIRTRMRVGTGMRDAFGARVSLHWDEKDGSPAALMMRRVRTDGSFASAADPRVHFGLGQRGAPTFVEVQWPDGQRERFNGVSLGKYTDLVAGQGSQVAASKPVEGAKR